MRKFACGLEKFVILLDCNNIFLGENVKKFPLIIDADPGIDDSVALMLALKSPLLDIKLVTCTAGNVDIENVTQNTLNVLDFLCASPDIPVAAGAKKPLKRKTFNFLGVHGEGGIGGFEFPPHNRKLSPLSAVEHMHKVLTESKTKVTIMTIGPLTNIAMLILKYPQDVDNIERIVFMGGSCLETGSEDPYKEFNISSDPEAAEIVFASSVKKVMIPMEIGHTAFLNWNDVSKTAKTNAVGEFLIYMFRSYRDIFEVRKSFKYLISKKYKKNVVGNALDHIFKSYQDRHVKDGIATHDAVVSAYLIDNKICKTIPVKVGIKYFGEDKIGVAICDYEAEPNMVVATDINIKRFKRIYFRALSMANLERRVIDKNWRPVAYIAKV